MKRECARRLSPVTVSTWAAAVAAVAIGVQAPVLGAQAPGRAPDRADAVALLGADPGSYVLTEGKLERAGKDDHVPVLVQAEARPGANRRLRVPLVISGDIPQDWTLRIRLIRAGGAAGRPNQVEDRVSGAAGQVRAIREFELEPGNYEARVAVARQSEGPGWVGTVVRQPVSVPDLGAESMAAGLVVLGDAVAVAKPEDKDRPFVFGPTRLTPALGNRFKQGGDLHFALRVYNWKADENAKPDLSLEYVFYQQMAKGLRFFNKLKPQLINARTVDATFDGKSRAVATGMTVPLAAFPPGEFELTVRILDVKTRASVTQKVRFFVSA